MYPIGQGGGVSENGIVSLAETSSDLEEVGDHVRP